MPPQSIVRGVSVLRTVPAPLPVRAMVSAYDKRVNVAVTDCALDIVTVQGPVPEHTPPDQPAKLDVASGLAESVTTAPVG